MIEERHRSLRWRARLTPGAAPFWWRGPAVTQNAMALTFDDGPDRTGTPAVLDTLARFRAAATFFCLAERVDRAPGLLRELVAAGHEVGLHADRHERMDRLPVSTLRARLSAARAELEDAAGVAIRFHRPPFGRLSWRGLIAARQAGLEVVMWSHDPRDWDERRDLTDRLADAISRCLRPGAIVLLHDGGEWTSSSQGAATAHALSEALSRPGGHPSAVTVGALVADPIR